MFGAGDRFLRSGGLLTFESGASIAEVARAHRANANQVFNGAGLSNAVS